MLLLIFVRLQSLSRESARSMNKIEFSFYNFTKHMAYMFVGRDVIEKNILEDSRKFHPKPRFESYTY